MCAVECVAISHNPFSVEEYILYRFSCHFLFAMMKGNQIIFWFHFFFLFLSACVLLSISPSLSDLPTMKKPRSHTSSQAQWKPSDKLHYIVLVPIKADTICCQEHGDTLQKGNPPLQHPLPRGFKCFWMYIMLLQEDLFCQMELQRLELQRCPCRIMCA